MKNRGAQKLHEFRRKAQGPLRDGLNPGQPIPHARIAQAIECHTTYVQKMEAGDRVPGLKVALKLQQLGVADPSAWAEPAEADRSAA